MRVKALLLTAAISCTAVFGASAAGAATLTTSDGVLSIETPSDTWTQTQDPNYWFVISDGINSITIDHLSNGQNLPAVQVANDTTPGVFQAYVSTKNEVFVVKGLANTQENLASLMQIIGSIKVLKPDTKTAITQTTPAPQASEFSLRPINATYYVTCDTLRVRSGCSTDEAVIGNLSLGDEVTVIGAVTKGGTDYGWYQIQYNGANAYVSAGFLSTVKPSGSASSGTQNSSSQKSSGSSTATGSTFAVTDRYGYGAGTLTPHNDGYFYSADGVAFRSNGNGSYTQVNGGDIPNIVYDSTYLDRLYDEATSDPNKYPVSDGFSVVDGNGNLQGTLTLYSDGFYYSNDMQPYEDNFDGSYYGVKTGDTLYSASSYGVPEVPVGTSDYDPDDAITVYNEFGGSSEIYPADDGTGFYVDEDGTYYSQGEDGAWHTSTGDDDIMYW